LIVALTIADDSHLAPPGVTVTLESGDVCVKNAVKLAVTK
jgi:hypothetical protein